MARIEEWRGVEGLVYAEVTKDDATEYTTGAVKPLAGVAEISRTIKEDKGTKFYDNRPAFTIYGEGEDEIKIKVSVLPLSVRADILGQALDTATGAMIEGERDIKYFAIGYITKTTSGVDVYRWRLKGTFSPPEESHKTIDDGTDSNGEELTFTGVSTIHKFTKGGNKSARGVVVVNDADSKCDVTDFFDQVTDPDKLTVKN